MTRPNHRKRLRKRPATAGATAAKSNGRPPLIPTKAQRHRVSVAAGAGFTQKQIAAALGISVPTLRKVFVFELTSGAALRRMEAVHGLYRAALSGSAAAAKVYLSHEPEPITPPATKQKLGKKAQAEADAPGAQDGTEWSDLLPRNARLQ